MLVVIEKFVTTSNRLFFNDLLIFFYAQNGSPIST